MDRYSEKICKNISNLGWMEWRLNRFKKGIFKKVLQKMKKDFCPWENIYAPKNKYFWLSDAAKFTSPLKSIESGFFCKLHLPKEGNDHKTVINPYTIHSQNSFDGVLVLVALIHSITSRSIEVQIILLALYRGLLW